MKEDKDYGVKDTQAPENTTGQDTVKLPTAEANEESVSDETKKPPKCASPNVASKRIKNACTKAGVDVNGAAVDDAVGLLYTSCASSNTTPTREGFAEICKDQELGQFVLGMKKDPFKKTNKFLLIGAAVIIILLVACGIAYAITGDQKSADIDKSPKETASELSFEKTTESYVLDISAEAEGWDAETSSPVIVHVEGDGVDFYHAYDANDPDATVAVEQYGEYTLSFISPINADGSTYTAPEINTVMATILDENNESITKDNEPVTYAYRFENVAADEVADGVIESITEQVAEAVKKGDKTLTGASGISVVETVKNNAKANPKADGGAIEETSSEATSSAASETSQASGSTASNAASSSTESSGGNINNDSDNSSTHTHNWVAQTTTVHHDAVYQTVHHDAVYNWVHHDAVKKGVVVCNGCGAQFDTDDEWGAHSEASLLSGGHCGSYYTTSVVLQQAWDEQVLVTDAYDEQVLVSSAYDETITTGYKCSTCGATK